MATDALKMMEKQLIGCTQGQLGDISKVDTHELGEAIDMIKDLSEAIYYCTITQSMEKSEKENQMRGGETNINYYGNTPYYYTPRMMYPEMRDMERSSGYMYYPGGSSSGSSSSSGNSSGNMSSGGNNASGGGTRGYEEPMMMANMMRDPRQGRSPMRRRMYMEGKEMHKDANSQLYELEAYLQELSTDITEMVKDASPEEKATLKQKMTTLANKIN